jgi:GntP family gluconate:H+ symporter
MPVPGMWDSGDTLLVIWAAVSILLVVVLVAWAKVHPFLALLIAAVTMGLLAGEKPAKLIESITGGAGDTLGSVGQIQALGTMLGKLLAESGGADRLAEAVLDRAGPARVPWAMAFVAMIVGIPLFFEIGVVLLIPIIFVVARRVKESGFKGDAYLMVGLPALAGLSVLHGLVPPHPGPLIGIDALHADLGKTMLYGFIIAIPTVIVAGPIFARFATHWAHADPPKALIDQVASETKSENPPSVALVVITVLLPVVIMLGRTVVEVSFDKDSWEYEWAQFVGDPIIALGVGLIFAMFTFGYLRGFDRDKVNSFLGESLAPAAAILLIIGAGGAFKQVLIDSGIGDALGKAAESMDVSLLIVGWLIAVLIRLATGSATIAITTTAGIMAAILKANTGEDVNVELLVLSVGAGSLFFSQVNDAGFWLINQYFGMSVGDTIKTWSVMETIISVVGLGLVLVLNLVL